MIAFEQRATDSKVKSFVEGLLQGTTPSNLALVGKGLNSRDAYALAPALAANSTIISFNLSDNPIGDEGVTALAAALMIQTSLRRCTLRNVNLSDTGLEAISNALVKNTSLVSLDLSSNGLVGLRGTTMLAESLKHNSMICRVCLGETDVVDVLEVIQADYWNGEEKLDAQTIEQISRFRDVAEQIDAGLDHNGLVSNFDLSKAISSRRDLQQLLEIDTPSKSESVGTNYAERNDGFLHILPDRLLVCTCPKNSGSDVSHANPPRTLLQIGRDLTVEQLLSRLDLKWTKSNHRGSKVEKAGQDADSAGVVQERRQDDVKCLYEAFRMIRMRCVRNAVSMLIGNTAPCNLDLSGIGMKYGLSAQDLSVLSEALKVNTSVNLLNLSYNRIENQGVKFLADALKINSTLWKLDLAEKGQFSGNGTSLLSLSPHHAQIQEMLARNAIGRVIRNNGPPVFDLCDCGMREEQLKVFCKEIEVNDTIMRLDLTGFPHQITSQTIEFLIKALEVNRTICWVLVNGDAPVAAEQLERLNHLLDRNVQQRLDLNATNASTLFHGSDMFGFHLGPMQWTSDQTLLFPIPIPVSEFTKQATEARLQSLDVLPGWDCRFLRPCMEFWLPESSMHSVVDNNSRRIVAARSVGWSHFGCGLSKREVSTGPCSFWVKLTGLSRIGVMRTPFPEARHPGDAARYAEYFQSITKLAWNDVPKNGPLSVYFYDGALGTLCHGCQVVKQTDAKARPEALMRVVVEPQRSVSFYLDREFLGELPLASDEAHSRGLRLAFQVESCASVAYTSASPLKLNLMGVQSTPDLHLLLTRRTPCNK